MTIKSILNGRFKDDVINGKDLLTFFKKDDHDSMNIQNLKLIQNLDHSNFHNYLINKQLQDERNNNCNPEIYEYSKLKEQSLKDDVHSKNISDYNPYEQNIPYPNNLNELIPNRGSKNNMIAALQENGSDKLKGNFNKKFIRYYLIRNVSKNY